MGIDDVKWRAGTPEQVKRILAAAMNSQARIRLFIGDPDTGRDWCEELQTMGYVGYSGGIDRVPLLMPTRRSRYGPQIDTDNVLKIKIGGRVVYQHSRYQVPELEVRGCEVLRDGAVCARFKTTAKAESWARFMRGEVDRWG